ncbi:iron complex transport system permease protein [Breznakia blatticola]|uniref:Iron complex transport system permease protein n=1 Tax=Breznakia blatticola TaxID=1754012 RepID=A0A4R8A518_9FIRM|nr:iron chelate uptake ABC transporter family permease subunit [Breznakia blatticola]TDW25720.1 iron complex transport system permease protein [Breznakia blatticola]
MKYIKQFTIDQTPSIAKNKHKATTLQKRERSHKWTLVLLAMCTVLACVLYVFVGVRFDHPQLFWYALEIRVPKLIAMLVVALCIGKASMIFQSVIQNTIVTPCLLGMNSLYTLLHTAIVFFFGSASRIASNVNLSFAIDLLVMGVSATFIYGYLFKKTKYNILYVLLIGTVLSSLFGSMQSTMIRVMDPNEYDTLLVSLVASFSNVNTEIILFSIVVVIAISYILRKDFALLDVITLGKEQAINLGVDYDRTIRRLLFGVVLLIAVATALVGPISFLGLIVANIARQMFQTYQHRYLIMGSVLVGMIALIGGQVFVEHIMVYAVPLSVFVTVIGGLYFLYLLLRQKRSI